MVVRPDLESCIKSTVRSDAAGAMALRELHDKTSSNNILSTTTVSIEVEGATRDFVFTKYYNGLKRLAFSIPNAPVDSINLNDVIPDEYLPINQAEVILGTTRDDKNLRRVVLYKSKVITIAASNSVGAYVYGYYL